jgi:hypothetical protein
MRCIDAFAAAVAVCMVALLAYYLARYHRREILEREVTEFNPMAAWLRAGVAFCSFYLVSWATGTMQAIVTSPVATPEQLASAGWIAWVVGLIVLILVAYWGIWARFTIRFDRKLDLAPQIVYGLLWGTAMGQMILSIWRIAELIGREWATWQVFLLAYAFISVWQWLLMDIFWDIYISPEHDSPQSIMLKVPLSHIPNVTLSLIFFAIHRNYAIFVALQTVALVGASINMRMPAPWSKEKTPSARRAPSIFWGIPRCSGYISDDPENDPYLKAAHLSR